MGRTRILLVLFPILLISGLSGFALDPQVESRNTPERQEWVMDAGLGLFIH